MSRGADDSYRAFGHEWLLLQVVEDITPEEMQRRWDSMVKKTD